MLEREECIEAFLVAEQVDSKRVVVELNGKILPREQFDAVQLQSSDVVEVVTMVGGG